MNSNCVFMCSGTIDTQGNNSDTGSLSGGERSFSTLAFVMALGEEIASPFRAMDEFDVFMDAINKKVSLQLLVECASRNKRIQHIFLLPELDIGQLNLSSNPNVTVKRLKDPVRNQPGQRRVDDFLSQEEN